jgi:TonB family protein
MQQAYGNASAALAAGRLVSPTYDCAVYWLNEMRVREPYAQVVKEAEALVGTALLKRAEAAVVQRDVLAAQRWLGLAAVNGADPTAVSAVRRSLSVQTKQREIQAAEVAAGLVTKVDSAVGGKIASSSAATNLQRVALSNLEFTKFVEPKVPQDVIQSSPDGWVDVEFTVNTVGETTKVKLVASNLSSRFAAPSIAAVRKWRFEPYSRDGAAQAVSSEVRLRFDE